MKKDHSLGQFIVGIILFVMGIFWFTSKVTVTSGFGYRIGSFDISGGLVVVPFIIGVVWCFVDFDSIIAKIIAVLGLFIIIGSVIANTRFYFARESLYTYLIILVCICAGMGLVGKVLFASPHAEGNSKGSRSKKAKHSSDGDAEDTNEVDVMKELNAIKEKEK